MKNDHEQIRVVIVGGGFAGVICAQRLARALPGARIELISDRPHFEFTPSLYRVVTGHSPLEVCLPLREIFDETSVRVVQDTVGHVDFNRREVEGTSGSRYRYTYLVLALGSETNHFGIPGLAETAMSIKSIAEALRLKAHLHAVLASRVTAARDAQVTAGHIVVVGGGPSGVELAGELAHYSRELALRHGLDESVVTIDLLEAGPRILPRLPEGMARVIGRRLRSLGVNIFCNRAVLSIASNTIHLKDMSIEAETVVWTAGVKPNHLYSTFSGLSLTKDGRVEVDPYLRARGQEHVFIAGDAAATPFSGMAQTAIADGAAIADAIVRTVDRRGPRAYLQKSFSYALPLGEGWAAVLYHGVRLYGLMGWLLRRAADLRFFLTILPVRKALIAFMSGWRLSESCPICSDNEYYIGELEERALVLENASS